MLSTENPWSRPMELFLGALIMCVRWFSSGDPGLEPNDELSSAGERYDGEELLESSPESDDCELSGWISGALYDSIFVVEISSSGAEIFVRCQPWLVKFFVLKER